MNETNSQRNSINQILLIIIALFLVVVIMAIMVLWPAFQELQIAQKKVEARKEAIQDKENYISSLSQIKTELEEYQEEMAVINASLPDKPSCAPALSPLFNYLQKISSQSGLIFRSVAPFTISSSKDFSRLQETVSGIEVVGSYSSFKSFLYALENSSRLIQVENISFSKPEEEEKTFIFELKLKTYSY